MSERLKLLCVLAHPDDETLGAGGILAKYAAEGVETYLLTATRGEYGWPGDPEQFPGPDALGEIRQEELHAAARVLGLREGVFLNYIDGQVDQANPIEAIEKISQHIRRICPQVVVTFDPFGVYGHPDHIAISQYTQAAVLRAASSHYTDEDGYDPHLVSKLYYLAETQEKLNRYQEVLGELILEVNGEKRKPVGWESWAITTIVQISAYEEQIMKALQCHRSQFPEQEKINRLFNQGNDLWETATLYRVFSFANPINSIEEDLFEGLR